MDKTYKCDRCRCQDICKLETAFRNTQDKLDEIVENGNGNFSVEFVCRRMTDEPHNRAFIWNCMCGAWEAQQERHKIACNAVKTESANVAEQAIPDSMNVLQSSHGWDPKPVKG